MSSKKNLIKLGKIISSHGIKGYFKLEVYNKSDFNLKNYENKTYIKNIKVNLMKKFRKGDNLICSSSLFNSATDVSKFIGEYIYVDENELSKLKKNEYYHKDLMNCKVLDFNLKELGIVKAIHNFGAGDLLELKNHNYMIRLHDIEKKNIDLKNKIIILNENYPGQ